MSILVLKAGDIELNPGPNKKSHSYFSCCHWNVNSLPTGNYCKVAALKAYNSVYKYDFLCVTETFLFKTKKVAVVYRSPSQSTSEFESFLSGLEDLLSNVLCSKSQFTVALGDLNARSPAWWSEGITTLHGTQIDSLMTTHGFKQTISDPTHILPNSSSCIDLIFTDQPNYVIDSGTHPLHPNCYHQITFCQLNLKVDYPPPYERLVWNFKKSNNDAIKKSYQISELELSFLK